MSRLFGEPLLGKSMVSRVTPLPQPPLKGATGVGFARMLCKILSPKGLEVKILTTQELASFPRILFALPPP